MRVRPKPIPAGRSSRWCPAAVRRGTTITPWRRTTANGADPGGTAVAGASDPASASGWICRPRRPRRRCEPGSCCGRSFPASGARIWQAPHHAGRRNDPVRSSGAGTSWTDLCRCLWPAAQAGPARVAGCRGCAGRVRGHAGGEFRRRAHPAEGSAAGARDPEREAAGACVLGPGRCRLGIERRCRPSCRRYLGSPGRSSGLLAGQGPGAERAVRAPVHGVGLFGVGSGTADADGHVGTHHSGCPRQSIGAWLHAAQ